MERSTTNTNEERVFSDAIDGVMALRPRASGSDGHLPASIVRGLQCGAVAWADPPALIEQGSIKIGDNESGHRKFQAKFNAARPGKDKRFPLHSPVL